MGFRTAIKKFLKNVSNGQSRAKKKKRKLRNHGSGTQREALFVGRNKGTPTEERKTLLKLPE